jgi:hypothetical protein
MHAQASGFATVGDYYEPTTFRFRWTNPLTYAPYEWSVFRELPSWASNVVRDAGYSPERWDGLVESGSVMSHPAFRGEHRLVDPEMWALRVARREREGSVSDGRCPDCWGSGLAQDCDGGITGTLGAAFVCPCTAFARPCMDA